VDVLARVDRQAAIPGVDAGSPATARLGRIERAIRLMPQPMRIAARVFLGRFGRLL
jgi:hypothetical protein